MPYLWIEPPPGTDTPRELHLWPHRSLPRRGFAIFILATVAMLSLPLLSLLGRVELWWLLPFVVLAVAGIWWGIAHSYRTGEVREILRFAPDTLHLSRHDPGRDSRDWQANPHWVRVTLHRTGGPVPDYLTLEGGPRPVELGAFLTPEERRALHDEIARQLAGAQRPDLSR